MMILHEALMRCGYCGARVSHRLRSDEVMALRENRLIKRNCDYCVGWTEWALVEWKGNPPQFEAESEVGVTQGAAQRPHNRILVIDDDDLTAALLCKVLEAEDCTLEIANDGKEGLQKLVEQQYSLVICDMHMPGLDGKKVFRFIDEQALGSKGQIIFITGDTGPETRKFLQSTGCPYLYKPIQVLQLASMVREVLDANRVPQD